MKLNENWKEENGKYSCPICGKEYSKNGICSHIWRSHEDGKNFKPTKGKTAWNKGKSVVKDKRIKFNHKIEDIFCKNSNIKIKGSHKKKFLIESEILKGECCFCGNTGKWRDKNLVLILDHINGINNDNRFENLRFLCPNCNSQTETFTGRNLKGRKKIDMNEQIIIETIKNSKNIHQTLIKLNMSPKGDNYKTIKKIMIKYGLLFS